MARQSMGLQYAILLRARHNGSRPPVGERATGSIDYSGGMGPQTLCNGLHAFGLLGLAAEYAFQSGSVPENGASAHAGSPNALA